MTIVWNKVTWYSKLVALALFVALPFIGFWFGAQYGETAELASRGATPSSTISTANPAADYYSNVAAWQTDTRTDGGFSIAYPIDFQIDDNYATTASTDWRLGANGTPGLAMFMLTIPRAFEPQTNFADATLAVGKSGNAAAVADCLTPDPSGPPNSSVSTTTINGIVFSVFKSSDAGAGNLYQTTSYRTINAGTCYAVEYTIHSGQIANYPASYDLQPFDLNKATGLLDRIVGTFKFL